MSWVAIQHGALATFGSINVYDFSNNSNTTYPLAGRPGFAFSTDKGNFVVGLERSVGIFDPRTNEWKTFIDGIDANVTGTVINDGVTWAGNLIFGTKDLEFKTKKAGLYFYRASDKQLFCLRADQICSNGKCVVEVDSNHIDLYDIDSPTRRVVVYRIDLQLGKIVSERTVIDLASDEAVPDGMTMTPDGKSLIVSLYNPNPAPFGRTVQYSIADGSVEEVWQTTGSPQATCPQWVLVDGRACLAITTAVEHMPAERRDAAPFAGALFLAETAVSMDRQALQKLTPVFVE